MIINKNIVVNIELPIVCEREVLRYAKTDENDVKSVLLLEECKKELIPKLKGTAVYRMADFRIAENECKIGHLKVKSNSLAKAFSGSDYVLLFVATIGIASDILVSKYEKISISKAHIMNSLATERIEAVCDALYEKIERELFFEGYEITRRFSAGYGDLDIEFQRDIFKILTPEKYIGVSLNDSLLMSPSKSVSALIGVKKTIKQ